MNTGQLQVEGDLFTEGEGRQEGGGHLSETWGGGGGGGSSVV